MREPVARNAPNPDNAPGLGEDASFPSHVPSLPSSIRWEILRQGGGSGRPQGSTNLDNSLTSIFFASQQCSSSAPCSTLFPDRRIGIATTNPRMDTGRTGNLFGKPLSGDDTCQRPSQHRVRRTIARRVICRKGRKRRSFRASSDPVCPSHLPAR